MNMTLPYPPDDPGDDADLDSSTDHQIIRLLHRHLQRHEPSAVLRAGIRAQVALKTAAWDSTRTPSQARYSGASLLAWRSAAAGLVVGIALTLTVGLVLQGSPGAGDPHVIKLNGGVTLESALVASHINALGHGALFQVASSDRHTVKPWFQGKLDFAPPVPDLVAAGYPLLGGRIDQWEGRSVAALVYMHRQHVVSVYIWPDERVRSPDALTRMGFHLSHWSEGGMQVWVVTDADAAEVMRFAQAWRTGVGE